MSTPADGTLVYSKAFCEGLAPDPLLTVSQWAEAHRILSPKAAAEPGKWRNERTPYLVEIMDSLSATNPVRSTVFMKAAQIGGTEAGNNWLGYLIDHVPAAILMVMPTVDLAKRNSRQRIDPLIEDCPKLSEKVHDRRERDAGNTMLAKEFPNGLLVMTGANSAVGLRSTPVRYLFLDEVDAYPGDTGEGDPVLLARRGTRTFGNRSKELLVSTPGIEGRSRIKREFLKTDQRYYHVPCPDCGHMQKLVWAQIKWEDNDPATVKYACKECGVLIDDNHKQFMLEHGMWVPDNPRADPTKRGYHLNALYSPPGMFSWASAVQMFLEARGKREEMMVWTNTVLGETFVELGDAPEWQSLYLRRETYAEGIVPMRAVVLTAGIDVQKDRFEVEIVGWGPNRESWSVDYFVVQISHEEEGNANKWEAKGWKDLERALGRMYPHESGAHMPISKAAIDTGGHWTSEVYAWVRTQRADRVIAIKGRETHPTPIGTPTPVDVNMGGKKIARGIKLWPVGTNHVKSELYARLNLKTPLHPETEGWPTGWCHFPERPEEYFKQLTAEQVVPRFVRGYRVYVWEHTVHARNEALDCRVYARAAAALVGIDRWSEADWDAQRDALAGEPEPPPSSSSGTEDDGGYWQRWN